MLNPHIRQYICKNTKNIQKVDDMDGFCWQSELDLTLFYKIEGCWGIFWKNEILNDLNDRDLNDRIDEYMYPYTSMGSLLEMSKLPLQLLIAFDVEKM